MAYLGNIPATRYTTMSKQTIAGNGGTSYTMNFVVSNDQEVQVFVNNVMQEPGVAYTTSGNILNMTGVVRSTDSFYVVYIGKAQSTVTIPEKQTSGDYSFDGGTIYLDSGNNRVGIGTLTPTSNLHVIGTANVTSNVVVGGTLSVGGNNVSPVQSFRNKIINGNFDFWQRQTSNTNVVSGQYVADRWINVKFGTPTLNISQQSFTVGQTAVPNESQYFYRANTVSSTGTANGIYIAQRVESVRTLAGQTATLSFWAKADASKNIAIEFVQNFGTNGSAEANGVNVTTFSLTSSWQQFSTTITLPSISGKTVDSANANYLGVNFWLDAGSTYNTRTNTLGQQSGNFDISQVQLEAGSVATPFEVRPLGVELALCQRYFQKYGRVVFQCAVATLYRETTYFLPVVLRAYPTVTLTYSANSPVIDGSTYTTPSQVSIYNSTGDYFIADFTVSAEL
jgi:hypothetical protein